MMNRIAVIDDRQEDLILVEEALKDAIKNLELDNEWQVVSSNPLESATEYGAWITEKNISIFIIDERLFEATNGVLLSGYLGSDVVEEVRKSHKTLPIIGVSADDQAESLNAKFGLFDEILVRDKLVEKPEHYIERFKRLLSNFIDENEEKLTELSALSEKIASGSASRGDVERASAIQQGLEIPITVPALSDRDNLIKLYKQRISTLEKLEDVVESYLQSERD